MLVGGRSPRDREEIIALRNALVAIEWPGSELRVFATLGGPLFALGDEALLAFRQQAPFLRHSSLPDLSVRSPSFQYVRDIPKPRRDASSRCRRGPQRHPRPDELHRRRRWQQLFGLSSKSYPLHYRPNPASRRYVQHLRLWYAQSHPDEDFAESFAVWLRPRSNWRTRYAGWPALKKLEYVDELMNEIAGKRPLLTARERVDPLHELSDTLGSHYQRKQAFYAFEPPKTYDRDLYRLFSANPRHRRAQPASLFIRRHRAHVRKLVARWTGENQLTLDAVLDDMIIRCRAHNLRAVGSERKLLTDFTVLLTAKTMHALFGPSRRKWIAL